MNVGTVLIAILVFGLLIFIHELGHFFVARAAGVRVNEFALGMGPVVFKVVRGDTQYALRAFPLGGFCAMEGDDEESHDPRAFCNVGIGRRIAIIVAGSAMNVLLGLALLAVLTSQQDLLGTTTVAGFKEGAVSSAYLQPGDEIRRVNGHRVRTDNDLVYEFMRDRDGVMDMVVLRGGEELSLKGVTFDMYELEDGTRFIAVDFMVAGVRKTPVGILTNSVNWTGSVVKQVWGSLVDLVTGRYSLNQLSGPVGTATIIGEAVGDAIDKESGVGIKPLLSMVAFITINLGVFNLLPLPALDGGRLLFLLLELVRRKPVNPKYEGWVHAVGFMLLIGLMLVVTFNDVIKLVLGGE